MLIGTENTDIQAPELRAEVTGIWFQQGRLTRQKWPPC